jgi:hypothetical protein
MNEVAATLGIDFKRFRNKSLLRVEIDRVKNPFYNAVDPCTLEDIRDIDPKYRMEWTQDGHRFCADVRSIRRMFENDDTILPWAVDFCSGTQAACNPEEYKRRFDMRHVPEVVSRVESFVADPSVVSADTDVPFHAKFLREIEDLVGGDNDPYIYGIVINKLLHAKKSQIYQRVCGSMLKVLYRMQSSTESDEDLMLRDTFYHFCYVVYSTTSFHIHSQTEHLAYLTDILKRFHWIVGSPAQFIIQTVLTELE